jgi:arylsulfatase A-like enzyme/phosphodiesterase/alkaline phosphatase D-like protein
MNQIIKLSLGAMRLFFLVICTCLGCFSTVTAEETEPPNVLFIAVDDLNAWVTHLGANPQAKTPNIDRLAKMGTTFSQAYCAVPACNPARAALMTGQRPWTTGCYMNSDPWKGYTTEGLGLSAQFKNAGYHVAGCGKIYHSQTFFESEWSEYMDSKLYSLNGEGVKKYQGYHQPLPHDLKDDDLGDWHMVDWCIEQLNKKHDKPLFLACGLYKPHLPFAVPRKYYEMFPRDQIQLPPHREDDLDDVPAAGVKMANPNGDHAKFLKSDRWKDAVQSYLATCAYTDMNIGRLLDGLAKSPYAKNTIIVLWGDHGWSFGEKSHWRKFALWEEPTRAPLIWVAPGVTKPGTVCARAVDFMTIYPTLCELTGVKTPKHVEGPSAISLLRDPASAWSHPAITTHGYKNHAVRTDTHRYIQYADGSEELYDHTTDPNEWSNIAPKPETAALIQTLKAHLPTMNAEPRKKKSKKAKASEAVHMANGIKIGEVTSSSAIIWTRLTKNPERNIEGTPFAKNVNKERKSLPIADLDKMEGSVPGTAGEVRITYWPVEQGAEKVILAWTPVEGDRDFTCQIPLSELKAGTRYSVIVEGRPTGTEKPSCRVQGEFGSAPGVGSAQKVSFTVVTGQDYPRRDDLENGHKIYPEMQKLSPDFFVHTGDIEYYDKPAPYADSVELARFKWNRIYSMPFQRTFHNKTASYFIKDDHDTLKNDCWPGQVYGNLTWEQGVKLFPEQIPIGKKTYRTVRWGKDLQIWLMEGRDFRSPNNMPDGPKKTIWGEEQKKWFFDSVQKSDATFRVLISPTPIVGPDRGGKNDNHANKGFTHEGAELRAFLGNQKNMFVVCGDRHWQYVSEDSKTGVREYSCGPTANSHAGGFSEKYRSPMHQYLNVVGGFLRVEVARVEGQPEIRFQHYGVGGKINNNDTRSLE